MDLGDQFPSPPLPDDDAAVNGAFLSDGHADDSPARELRLDRRTSVKSPSSLPGDNAADNDAVASPRSRSSSPSASTLAERDNPAVTLSARTLSTAMLPPSSAGHTGDSPAREPQLDKRRLVANDAARESGAASDSWKDEGIRESALIRKISGVGLSSQRPSPPEECCICGSPPKMLDHACIVCSATTCSGCVINLRHLACPYCHDIERNANELRNEAITIKAINKASKWFSAAKGVFRDVADNVMVRANKNESQENESWRRTYESDYGVDYAGFGIGPSE
eukprot:GEMP01006234.1.p1 GENE.GEMP01006234.1~~GEMP01006234.1.p1  ORF type:complete len:281 (+),score=73.33 GEMP01006234.1:75-917(+)